MSVNRTPHVVVVDGAGVSVEVPSTRVALPLTIRHGRSDVASQPESSTCSLTLLDLPDASPEVAVGHTLRVYVDGWHVTTTYTDEWRDTWSDMWGTPHTASTYWTATRFVGQVTDLETSRAGDQFTTAVSAAGAMSAWAAGEPTDTAPGGTWPGSQLLDGAGSPDMERFLPEQPEADRTRLAMSSRNLAPDPTLSTPDYLDAMQSTHTYNDDNQGTHLPLVTREPWQDTRDPCCGNRRAGRAVQPPGKVWTRVPMTPWAPVTLGEATQL